jgi:hypothetical protein
VLAEPSDVRTVRAAGGTLAITDGPSIEGKEHFGGYLLVDCELDRPKLRHIVRRANTANAA